MAKFPARLPRSRDPCQPTLSYERIEHFTKDLEVKARSQNRAHVKRPQYWQNNNSARASRFFVHFFAVVA